MIKGRIDDKTDLSWQNSLAAAVGDEIGFTLLSEKYGLIRNYALKKDMTQEQTMEFMLEAFARYSEELKVVICNHVWKAMNE